jgi:chemotaxis methyl-accepting protein methylase
VSDQVQPGRAALTPELRSRYLDVVDRYFGIRESDYGAARIDDAVSRVLPHTRCGDARALLEAIEADEHVEWLDMIVQYLTVGETYFMRDPAQIAALRGTILPDILERRKAERRVRMWSAGCSTGEEPYTLAILLNEQTVLDEWETLLVGTDVNRESLRIAREGRYPAWSFRATRDTFRQRYFEAHGKGWRLKDSVRRRVRFGWSNLAADPLQAPSNDFDLIVCRNVTIYFDDATTQRLYGALIEALAPGGWLMLGSSDPMPADRGELQRIESANTVLWRRGAGLQARPVVRPAARPHLAPPMKQRSAATPTVMPEPVGDGRAELEAGLLALEAGSAASALEWLRRATFRDPHSPVGQFALARAYLGVGDTPRAHAALLHLQRLLLDLRGEELVPDSDALPVETLRQAVQTHLSSIEGAQA